MSQFTFYFAEEGPGCGSEDIKKECDVNCIDFFFFSVFLVDVMGGKITVNLTLRLLMSYIYGAPILDVSRSHTTTQHSR